MLKGIAPMAAGTEELQATLQASWGLQSSS